MEEMSRYFPRGMKVVYPYDTTPFVKVAIKEVVKTVPMAGASFSISAVILFTANASGNFPARIDQAVEHGNPFFALNPQPR